MRTSTSLSAHLLLSLCTAAVAFGCSGGRDTGGTKIRPTRDGGSGAPRDGGDINNTTDAGPNPCANNNCAPFQLVGMAPACECLPNCQGGYEWNAATMACDPINNPPRDGGVNNPTRDGGMMQQGGCNVDTDCQMADPNGVCLINDGSGRCAGGGNCACFSECDPYVPTANSTCGMGNGCFWLGTMGVVPGVCQPLGNGGTHAQACTVTFDLGGNIDSDSCERASNHFCIGVSSMANPPVTMGVCSRLCDDRNPGTVCPSLGTYQCDPLEAPNDGVGLCLNVQSFTDIGQSCTVGGDCQSGACSATLSNSCTASCTNVLDQCPMNSVCLVTQTEGNICVQQCTFGNDTACTNLNPNTICERIGMFQDGSPIDVCIPRCTQDADCGGGTCNTATGHCQ
ncbi:MAG: hypothetical protein RIT81_17985 [Deltaproteobacteria bacterium]